VAKFLTITCVLVALLTLASGGLLATTAQAGNEELTWEPSTPTTEAKCALDNKPCNDNLDCIYGGVGCEHCFCKMVTAEYGRCDCGAVPFP
jgi:hypothetical protein